MLFILKNVTIKQKDRFLSMENDIREFDDFDVDLQKKEELLKEAEELSTSEDLSNALAQANSLQKRWKRIGKWDSLKEEELEDKFNSLLDVIYSKRKDIALASKEAKEAIIEKAKEVSEMTRFSDATKKMNELMDEWKAAGRSDKETDDSLWAAFSEIRQSFFDKKNEFFANREANMAKAKEVKETIVAKAKEVAESTHFKSATEAMNKLMDEWKAAGFSGKEYEDQLWEEFSAARKTFFDARSKYYAEMDKIHAERLEKKKALVAEVRETVMDSDFSKEVTAKVKTFRDKWKEIGPAGKSQEDSLWTEFNGLLNQYFDGLKSRNAEKHEEWKARMLDNIAYKKAEIDRTKNQINRIMANAKDSLRESAMADAEEEVAEKNQYIAKLEAEIADIEKKIAE